MKLVGDTPCDLLIGHELDSLIRNDSHAVGAIALEHASHALLLIHVLAALRNGQSHDIKNWPAAATAGTAFAHSFWSKCCSTCQTPVYSLEWLPCTCIKIFKRSRGATAVRDLWARQPQCQQVQFWLSMASVFACQAELHSQASRNTAGNQRLSDGLP